MNNTAAAGSGIDNINGTVDATDNWWGCNQGPSTAPCNTVNDPNLLVTFDPWIVLSHTPNPAAIAVGNTSTLTASFLQDNHGSGNLYNEPRAAIEIGCTDCHGTIYKRADTEEDVTSGPAGGKEVGHKLADDKIRFGSKIYDRFFKENDASSKHRA